jgi:hypothetical protein
MWRTRRESACDIKDLYDRLEAERTAAFSSTPILQ